MDSCSNLIVQQQQEKQLQHQYNAYSSQTTASQQHHLSIQNQNQSQDQQQQQMKAVDGRFQDKPPQNGGLQFCATDKRDQCIVGDVQRSSPSTMNSQVSSFDNNISGNIINDSSITPEVVPPEATYQTGQQNSEIEDDVNKPIQRHEEQSEVSQQQTQGLEEQEEEDEANGDEETFVALCTDASSVLNNDPTRRYYINKLYQPMNAQQEGSSPVEHDDEYLLYQELRFLESTAQELTDERQGGVQLTKILEDDDGEDDQLLDEETNHREDPLDRLHLTTIIEAFESFPTSPLIIDKGDGHERDPLISDAQKPDSTEHDDEGSPASSSGGSCSVSSGTDRITSNYLSPADNHHHHHPQFDCDQDDDDLGLRLRHNHQDHGGHFFSMVPNENSMNHESHHHSHHHRDHNHHHLGGIHHHQQQQLYGHQINQNNSSEISCFQQVSTTFLPLTNESSTPDHMSTSLSNDCETKQQSQVQTSDTSPLEPENPIPKPSSSSRQSRKRCLQRLDGNPSEATLSSDGVKTISAGNRLKKKRIALEEEANRANLKSSPSHSVSSTVAFNNHDFVDQHSAKAGNGIHMTHSTAGIYKTNDYQPGHITHINNRDRSTSSNGRSSIANETDRSIDDDNDDDDDVDDDDDDDKADGSISSGRRGRHSHMSKYRRRTANARERIRMREINQAFEKLKKVVPIELIQQSASGDESDQTSVSVRRGSKSNSSNNAASGQQNDSQSVKLTKITTLRLAVSYIAKLSEVLNQHPEQGATSSIEPLSSQAGVREDQSSSIAQVRPGAGESSTKGNHNNSVTVDGGSVRKRRSRGSARKSANVSGRSRLSNDGNRPKSQGQRQANEDAAQNKTATPATTTTATATATTTLVLTNHHQAGQQQRHQPPILIANNILSNQGVAQQANSFVPIQPQQQHQQFAYAHQQPLTISQATTNGQDRTFVTPVAVAILGIQTGNGQGTNEPQALQLLGIQSPHQLQQRGPHHQIQTNSPYNLIAQHQPQQVTLTLNDLNGLSVLRLNQPQQQQQHQHHQQQTPIQIQPGRSTMIQQPQILATTTSATGYNYATYQPLQISQVQTSNGMTTFRQIAQQSGTTLQFHSSNTNNNHNLLNRESGDICANTTGGQQQRQQQGGQASENYHTMSTSTTITGNDSDCRNFGISPNMIAQHLNNSNNNVVQATQIKFQQSNCSGQLLPTNNMTTQSPGCTQLFQAQASTDFNGVSAAQAQASLIYINQPPTSITSNNANSSPNNNHQHQQQLQQQQQQQGPQVHKFQQMSMSNNSGNQQQTTVAVEAGEVIQSNNNNSHPPFEQMKFITQFSSNQPNQTGSGQRLHTTSEASIRQLVASLATSIQPNGGCDKPNKTNNPDEQVNRDSSQQQRQQPKRTYRFHNYDGNMITNHLYGNNNGSSNGNNNLDKQGQQQQATAVSKRCQQQQQQADAPHQLAHHQSEQQQAPSNSMVGGNQRSRQNSLSSICSTISSASSSMGSSSLSTTASPMVSTMVKSPALESGGNSNSSSSAQTLIGGAEAEPVVVGSA